MMWRPGQPCQQQPSTKSTYPTPAEDDVAAESTINHPEMLDPVAVAERMKRATNEKFRDRCPDDGSPASSRGPRG